MKDMFSISDTKQTINDLKLLISRLPKSKKKYFFNKAPQNNQIEHYLSKIEQDVNDINVVLETTVQHNTDLENQLNEEKDHLISSSDQYKSVMNCSDDMVIILDNNYCIKDLNDTMVTFFKKPRHELIGVSFLNLWSDTGFISQIQNCIDRTFLDEDVKMTLDYNHSYFTCFNFSSTPYCIDNKVTFAMVSLKDVSEEKMIKSLVKKQSVFLNQITDSIMILDEEGRILYWNKRCEELYGWTEKDVLGKKVDDVLYTPSNKHLYTIAMNEYHQSESWSGEVSQLTSQGDQITVQSQWSLCEHLENGKSTLLVINTNISEVKEIEDQFYRVQRMQNIGALTSGIIHDLNNVLSSFVLAIKVLKPKVNDEESKTIVGLLELSTKRGVNLVRQVLNFMTGVENKKVRIRLSLIVTELNEFIRETFPKNIRFKVEIPEGIWPIFASPTQIYQVMMNVCINARDAMKNGGEVSVDILNIELKDTIINGYDQVISGKYVHISISDSGTGITENIVNKIFTPFFTTKSAMYGTGLGLAVVKTIIENHSGYIDFKTEVGRGTQFNIYLPAL